MENTDINGDQFYENTNELMDWVFGDESEASGVMADEHDYTTVTVTRLYTLCFALHYKYLLSF